MSSELQKLQAAERARGLMPERHRDAAGHPLWFYQNGQFYSWDAGLPVAASKTTALVRDAKLNTDFWTWVDSLGERAWEVAA